MPGNFRVSPMLQGIPMLKGFLSGSLVVGGVFTTLGPLVQSLMFFTGLFIFIDAVIPNGEVSVIATTLFVAFGGLSSLMASLSGAMPYWCAAVSLVAVVFYYFRFMGKRRRLLSGEEQK